jgi:predicted Ser/Thr protein kinase
VVTRVGQSFGKYKLVKLLGKGGMGDVYEALDTIKNRTVALKILTDQYSQDERFRERFKRESRAAAILQEPHVIPIHDWGEVDDHLYIDMRLVPGQTLHDMLRGGPIDPERATSIIGQIASALDAAHAAGLIHRDVKPQNIMVTPDDFAYLVDFGIAETKGDSRLTMTGTQVGSMAYMAPERFGDEQATPAVDVYSLACVLYEALTGSTPFRTDSLEQIMGAHISAPPPRPSVMNPRVPVALDEVTVRGMAKQPDDRHGSAGALGRAAARALPVGAGPQPYAATLPGGYASTGGAPQGGQGTLTGPTAVADATYAAPQGSWVVQTVIGVVGALLLGAIGIVIGMLAGHNNTSVATSTGVPGYVPPPTSAPQSSSMSSASLPPGSPETVIRTAPPVTVTSPVAPPGSTRAQSLPSGDLGLTMPMSYPSCNGQGIVVLGSVTTPGLYAAGVQQLLDAHPGAFYLRTDQTCPSLRSATEEGNPIYAVFELGGNNQGAVCAAVRAAGGNAYGKWLNTTTDPGYIIPC